MSVAIQDALLVTESGIRESGLELLGPFIPRCTADVNASPISVGFETLDRYHFDPEKTYPHLAALGAKWARVQTGWNRCEREQSVYEFAWLDDVVDNLLAIGVQPFFNLGFGNLLYTPDAPHDSARGYVAAAYGADAAQAWENYVTALARHFADRVTHWEIWNEPNTLGFWQPNNPDPKAYVRLLADTVPVVRRNVPGAVIIGGVFSLCHPAKHMSYVEECFAAGMGTWLDKLSWHPYRTIPEHGFEAEVKMFRRLITKHAPHLDLWQGECGCQSQQGGLCEFMDIKDLNELIQAKWVLRRMLSDLALELEFTQYFHTVDLFNYIKHDGPSGLNQYMGLLRGGDYSPKPSFHALQTICSLFDTPTEHWGAMCFVEPEQDDCQGKHINPAAVKTAAFRRRKSVIYAFWVPSDWNDPFPGALMQLEFWHGKETSWKEPVLIDPVAQMVYRLPTEGMHAAGGGFKVPVSDAPLLVTDAGLLRQLGCL